MPTPDQWIAILALLVALVTPITSWVVARHQTKADETTARTARNQERRAVLYVETMEMAYLMLDIVNRTRPMLSNSGDPGPPSWPDEGKMRLLNARSRAFASPAVQEQTGVLNDLFRAFRDDVDDLEHANKGERADSRTAIEISRQAFRAQVTKLGDLINAELAA